WTSQSSATGRNKPARLGCRIRRACPTIRPFQSKLRLHGSESRRVARTTNTARIVGHAERTMKIIDRYVTWNFFKNYLVSFMVLIGMYVVLDMVFNFDDLADLKGRGDAAAASSVLSTIGN